MNKKSFSFSRNESLINDIEIKNRKESINELIKLINRLSNTIKVHYKETRTILKSSPLIDCDIDLGSKTKDELIAIINESQSSLLGIKENINIFIKEAKEIIKTMKKIKSKKNLPQQKINMSNCSINENNINQSSTITPKKLKFLFGNFSPIRNDVPHRTPKMNRINYGINGSLNNFILNNYLLNRYNNNKNSNQIYEGNASLSTKNKRYFNKLCDMSSINMSSVSYLVGGEHKKQGSNDSNQDLINTNNIGINNLSNINCLNSVNISNKVRNISKRSNSNITDSINTSNRSNNSKHLLLLIEDISHNLKNLVKDNTKNNKSCKISESTESRLRKIIVNLENFISQHNGNIKEKSGSKLHNTDSSINIMNNTLNNNNNIYNNFQINNIKNITNNNYNTYNINQSKCDNEVNQNEESNKKKQKKMKRCSNSVPVLNNNINNINNKITSRNDNKLSAIYNNMLNYSTNLTKRTNKLFKSTNIENPNLDLTLSCKNLIIKKYENELKLKNEIITNNLTNIAKLKEEIKNLNELNLKNNKNIFYEDLYKNLLVEYNKLTNEKIKVTSKSLSKSKILNNKSNNNTSKLIRNKSKPLFKIINVDKEINIEFLSEKKSEINSLKDKIEIEEKKNNDLSKKIDEININYSKKINDLVLNNNNLIQKNEEYIKENISLKEKINLFENDSKRNNNEIKENKELISKLTNDLASKDQQYNETLEKLNEEISKLKIKNSELNKELNEYIKKYNENNNLLQNKDNQIKKLQSRNNEENKFNQLISINQVDNFYISCSKELNAIKSVNIPTKKNKINLIIDENNSINFEIINKESSNLGLDNLDKLRDNSGFILDLDKERKKDYDIQDILIDMLNNNNTNNNLYNNNSNISLNNLLNNNSNSTSLNLNNQNVNNSNINLSNSNNIISTLNKFNQNLRLLQVENEKFVKEIEKLKAERTEKSQNLYNIQVVYKKDKENFNKIINTLENKISDSNETLKHKNAILNNNSNEIEKIKKEILNQNEVMRIIREENEQKEMEINNLKNNIDLLEKENKVLNDKIRLLNEELTKCKEENKNYLDIILIEKSKSNSELENEKDTIPYHKYEFLLNQFNELNIKLDNYERVAKKLKNENEQLIKLKENNNSNNAINNININSNMPNNISINNIYNETNKIRDKNKDYIIKDLENKILQIKTLFEIIIVDIGYNSKIAHNVHSILVLVGYTEEDAKKVFSKDKGNLFSFKIKN